ncbi:XRE family transcriptional regulator [Egibacter rhizosphaerae]|uniref:XRE family transcriptional regulator n=1 Tax=Egibacter rhizosphaerae TaxID=1670831 RepID=A0A411YDX8_9ACTN|nr:helix-turn-helix transcriptional regulator [Egibacter rhizosphaerae]QBI19380.1 XRE family transcriptional regulator [Egibacter rhizosphaerae]
MATLDPKQMGDHIKRARTKKEWSQDALAQRVGVTQQTIHDWESGAHSPRLTHLTAISNALDVSLDELVYGEIDAAARRDRELAEVVTAMNDLKERVERLGGEP